MVKRHRRKDSAGSTVLALIVGIVAWVLIMRWVVQ